LRTKKIYGFWGFADGRKNKPFSLHFTPPVSVSNLAVQIVKKIPSFLTLSINMNEDLKEIVYNNGKIKKDFLRANNNLCRITGAEPAQDE
jgi:hypothetical protein